MFITHAFQNVALLLFPCCFLAIAILHLLNSFCCNRCMFKTVAAHAETISLTCYSFIGSSAQETNCSNLKTLGSRYAAKLQYPCREPQIFLLSILSNCIEMFLSISLMLSCPVMVGMLWSLIASSKLKVFSVWCKGRMSIAQAHCEQEQSMQHKVESW